MSNLSRLRSGWDEIEAEETRLLRQLTPLQGLQQFFALQSEFEPWLRETEAYFRQERNAAIIELQTRLEKIESRKRRNMHELVNALVVLQNKLENAGLPSMAIGGMVVGIWGEPRLTRDVDVKVLAQRDESKRVLEVLAEYAPLNADPTTAFQRNAVAFFLDKDGTRLDIMLADNVFDEAALARAQTVELLPGHTVRVCSAEDLILYKLISTRTKDRADVEGIIRRQGNKLDDRYVEKWLRDFEVALDDSTLISEYRRLRKKFTTK